MTASELRLGNYVLCQWTEEEFSEENNDFIEINKEKIGKVVKLDSTNTLNYSIVVETKTDDGAYVEDFEYILPIPLTEEWLLKFGFKESEYDIFINDDCEGLRLISYGKFEGYQASWWNNEIINLDYLHQLQNLYLSLTGEELTLKTE